MGNAITIATNSVTLDVNGFTITSTAFSANGAAVAHWSCRQQQGD